MRQKEIPSGLDKGKAKKKGVLSRVFGKKKQASPNAETKEEQAGKPAESLAGNLKQQEKEKELQAKRGSFEFFMPDVPGIDGLFNKGVPNGATVLVEGGPGSGKTIMCLQACVGACKRSIKVLYMSFEEPEYRLREHLREFDFKPEEYERKGILKIKRFNALDIARSVEALLSEAKKELMIDIQPVLIPQDFQPDIVFVDSLTSISSAFSGEENRFRIYMEQLFRYLEANRITSFLIRETPIPTHIGLSAVQGGEAVSFLSDGIICIYNVFHDTGERGRAIEILKMRGEAIKRKLVEMEIQTNKGMVIYPDRILKGKYTLT